MSLFRNLLIEKATALPSIYQAVEFLQSDGKAYINTGFVMPEDGATFEIDFVFKQTYSNSVLFGSRLQEPPYPGFLGGYIYTNWSIFSTIATFSTRPTWSASNQPLTVGESYNYKVRLYKDSSGNYLVADSLNNDEEVVASSTTTYVQPGDYPVYLFAVNYKSIPVHVSIDRNTTISSFKISTPEGQTVMDLVPCVRKADSVPGMWDKVGRQFLTNAAASGAFIYE